MGSCAHANPRGRIPLLSMGFEQREADWLTLAAAKRRVLAAAREYLLPAERRPLADALSRALAEDVRSTVLLPPWDNSAMDGYAVRGSDIAGASFDSPVTLSVSGVVRPGHLPAQSVTKGTAIRIMTGGILPDGADSVVRVEDTDAERTAGQVVIVDDRDRERNVRPRGEDLRVGDLVLEGGTAISAAQVAVLSSLGITNVSVHRQARVAILSNGDELVSAAGTADREAGAVIDSNGPMLAAAVRAAGGDPFMVEIVPDDPAVLRRRLEEAAGADLVITSGGASMGDADLFKRVLDGMGFDLDFWRVRLRPGSPVSFGRLPSATADGPRRVPLFGLPGNPVSAFVTFQLFVRPFMLALAGHRRTERPTVRGRAAERLAGSGAHEVFLRVRLTAGKAGEWLVTATGPQGSGLVSSIGSADGLAVLPEGVEAISAGEPVEVILLGEGPGWHSGRPGAANGAGDEVGRAAVEADGDSADGAAHDAAGEAPGDAARRTAGEAP